MKIRGLGSQELVLRSAVAPVAKATVNSVS